MGRALESTLPAPTKGGPCSNGCGVTEPMGQMAQG